MPAVFLLFLMFMGSTPLHAIPAPQKAFVGCVNRLPDGTLQFGAVPSGDLFVVRGETKLVEEHVNQLVRVFGEPSRSGNDNNALPALTVDRVQVLAESCTSVLPAKQFEEVPGKVGEDSVAVPVTTTSTDDRTTPGFQTQAASAQLSGSQSASPTQTVEPPTAPPHPEQVAQSEAAANVDARAVERTEILPGSTLGVSGSAGTIAALPASQTVAGAPAELSAKPVIVTISGHAVPKLSAPRVSIRAGQTVEWLNSTATMQEIIANPARAEQPSSAMLPAGVQPFDSGFLRPDHSFQYRFTVPGVYRYFCKLNNFNKAAPVEGEVIVER
jgi:plastocyanin